jgi:hypothetical protein
MRSAAAAFRAQSRERTSASREQTRVAVHPIRCVRDVDGSALALTASMNSRETSEAAADLVHRIESEYREMPGLNLSVAQAQRLWGLDRETCRHVLTLLVTRRVLRRTRAGTYLRAQ